MNVLPVAPRFECRVCGSSHIPTEGHASLCSACWEEFNRWAEASHSPDRSENTIARWMARRLMLDARRLASYGVTGRCEAVAGKERGWIDGFDMQCRNRAIGMRGDRRVCGCHARSTSPVFVGTEAHDPYADMERVMKELAAMDLSFRGAMMRALK